MKKEYILILIIFYMFVGPGPSVFFINKYTVSFFPLLSVIAVVWILKKEIYAYDFNSDIKNPKTFQWFFWGLKYSIFSHALCTLIFGTSKILTDDLINNYLIMPIYSVIIGSIIEEIVYRKIIFGFLSEKYNFGIGAIVSSIIFSIGHLSLDRFLAYFITGIVLCHVYKKGNTITTTILIHASLNIIAILVRTLKI